MAASIEWEENGKFGGAKRHGLKLPFLISRAVLIHRTSVLIPLLYRPMKYFISDPNLLTVFHSNLKHIYTLKPLTLFYP